MEFISHSTDETISFAENLAKSFKGGEVLTLSGELGAGKTVFSKGIAKGLGVKATVVSPTFTIMCQYLDGRLKLYHFDMYRLSSGLEAEEFGFSEYILDPTSVSLIEWSENVASIIPKDAIKVEIEKIDETTRKIKVEKWKH